MAHHLTTCTFCGVGCGLYLETAGNRVMGVYPSRPHPANAGRICVRGWHVHEIAASPRRLTKPLIKKNGTFQEVGWDEAFAFVVSRMQEIRRRHGPDSLAFLNSPRCSNEESYLLQKLARSVIGTNNVDHGTGVYANNSIEVLLETIGVAASTNSFAELAYSGVIVVDGVDLGRQLPTLGGAVLRAKLKGSKLIVVGNRRQRLVENADVFLQVRPGTEPVLYGAIAKVIIDHGLANLPFIDNRCRNYDQFAESVRHFDLLRSAEVCGVSPGLIETAALEIADAKATAMLYSTGIELRTLDHIHALVNVVLLTGNLGRPGAGIFALNEQNNLQGVCDMGMLPDRLPGYEPVSDPAVRARFAARWGGDVPANPGLSARSLLEQSGAKALWLCRYDPISTAAFTEAAGSIRQCEFVVVQHVFTTETARAADVILPTTAFGEEQVSFTSTERRIQLAQKVIEPLPGLTPAWQQIMHVANLLGANWTYRCAADVMDEIGSVVPFYESANYDNLARDYGRQWPCTKEIPLGTPYLFAHKNGEPRFKFVPVTDGVVHRVSKEWPFTLIFGHSLYYWNQNVLIRHSETLQREYCVLLLDYPEGFVELNTDDAGKLGIRDGEKIRLQAATASVVSTARVTPEVRSGTIYVPYFVRDVEEQILSAAIEGTVQVRVEKVAA